MFYPEEGRKDEERGCRIEGKGHWGAGGERSAEVQQWKDFFLKKRSIGFHVKNLKDVLTCLWEATLCKLSVDIYWHGKVMKKHKLKKFWNLFITFHIWR